ncbi:MAG: hypothetical protein CMI54_01595 [Parcubacteria group bacterium]|nr:hypothetical protein [Parcubacteria group bacterium]|tara:strand:+ start:27755 stop:27937 length:183 start_codon:yes stop_codon:yes gene_type:complete
MNKSTAVMIKETTRGSFEHLQDYAQFLAISTQILEDGRTLYMFDDKSSIMVDDQKRCQIH